MIENRIRKYLAGDEDAIKEITFRTGFKGEDLTGRNYIDDKDLFFLIFIYYYPKYEPQHCFVAEDLKREKVVGFICGTPNTVQQESRFKKIMIWRILFRVLSVTIWRYPKTFLTLLKMSGMRPSIDPIAISNLIQKYPAHLHINLLPEYQHMGLGSKLIQTYESHLLKLGISGVHLQTTSYNKKAIPFYLKNGYKVVNQSTMHHFLFDDLGLLTFAKTLEQDSGE